MKAIFKLVALALSIWLFSTISSVKAADTYEAKDISEGQVWLTKTEFGGPIFAHIQKIELWGQREVVHITVIRMDVETTESNILVGHMPFIRESFEQSVVEVVAEMPRTDGVATEGYVEWKRANGGVFTVSIAEALQEIFGVLEGEGIELAD